MDGVTLLGGPLPFLGGMTKTHDADIEEDVQTICFGGQFTTVEDGLGTPRLLIIREPSLKDKKFVSFIYNTAIKDAKNNDILSEIELRLSYNRKGIWTKEHEDEIELLSSSLNELRPSLENATGVREKRVLKNKVMSLESRLEGLLTQKRYLFSLAAERHAEEARHMAFIYTSTYDENNQKVWSSWSEFENEKDGQFIQNISVAISELESIRGKRIREIARSPDWRFQWNAGKKIGALFEHPLVELTPTQHALIYWSQVYDSVYESMDKPDDSVIEDDDKLDEWFKNQERKDKIKKLDDSGQQGNIKLSSNVSRHGEIFIVTNPNVNPSAPTSEDVNNLNDSIVRKFKQSEESKIKSRGLINEKDLRDRQNKMARKLIGSNAAILGKSGLGGSARGGRAAKRVVPGELI